MANRDDKFLNLPYLKEEAKKYDRDYFERAYNFPTDEIIDELATQAFAGLYSKEARDTLLRIYRSKRCREKIRSYEGYGLGEHEDVTFGGVMDHQDFPPSAFTLCHIEEEEAWEEMERAGQERLFELVNSDFYSVKVEAMKRLTDQDLLYRIATRKAPGEWWIAAGKLTDPEKLRAAVLENGRLLGDRELCERLRDEGVFRHYVENGSFTEQLYALRYLREEERLTAIALSGEYHELDCMQALSGISDEKRRCEVALNARHEEVRKVAAKRISEQDLLAELVIRSEDFLTRLNASEDLYDQACLSRIALSKGEGVYFILEKLCDPTTLIELIKRGITVQTAWGRLCTCSPDWRERIGPELVAVLIERNQDRMRPSAGDMAVLRDLYQAGFFRDMLKKYEKEPFRPRIKSVENDPGLHVDWPEVWLWEKRRD